MQTSPPALSQSDRDIIFNELDLALNCLILQALLHGMYTGIVAVTLWTIFSSPRRLHSTFLCTIIITLYVLSTIAFTVNWVFKHRAFIDYGDSLNSMFIALVLITPWSTANNLVNSISGGISTILIDATIIWRSWVLWDREWRVIFVPMVCAVAGTVMKTMQILSGLRNSTGISAIDKFATEIDWPLIYILLTFAVTLICTLMIVYRIFRHAPGMSASHKIVEMLIESSAMYTISLIIYLAFLSRDLQSAFYADIIATYAKVIAPTFLAGRVSAHANASSHRQQMVAMWENHPPLVGCFREEVTDNPDDSHQMVSGSSMGQETV
ncbi:hypothetical protein EDD85DRAFT_1018387 [Armillaria nabsnona]|nr:hypothetical protein EDD85DRAFT_1018387 [Armillaria nabsnona]